MEHILSLSYGKDSLACLGAIEELGLPLDRIVHAEVWATDTIHADLPEMVEFKKKADKIILDPGIGFGKSLEENLALIREPMAICAGRYPLLTALSRKRCIGDMTGRDTEDRLAGTLAADLISVQRGAKIIRVHDVSAAIDTLNVMKNLR